MHSGFSVKHPRTQAISRWLRAPKRLVRIALSALTYPARRRVLTRELEGRTPARRSKRPILIVLHPNLHPHLNDVQVQWLRLNFPQLTEWTVYKLLPIDRKTVESSSTVVFWVQDPVEHISSRVWRQCLSVEAMCRDAGVPMINRPSLYHRAGRVESSRRLRNAGLRTPAVEAIKSWKKFRSGAAHLEYPFVIRNGFGQSRALYRIDGPEDLDDPRLAALHEPVKVEWVDVADPQTGIYRKYRTFVIGERVVPHHLQSTRNWITRGKECLKNTQAMAEELAFIRTSSPGATEFIRASRGFGLEVLAYDWGYGQDGDLIVWEANPYPFVRFSGPEGGTLYRADAIHRTYAALTELCLISAGIAVPDRISALSSLDLKQFAAAAEGLQVVY